MQTKNTIFHHGEVIGTEGDFVNVRILQASACASCAAAQLCKSSESKEKVMKIPCSAADTYAAGDRVRLQIDIRNGLKACLLAYVIPLMVIVAELATVQYLGGSDGIAALGCMVFLALYYTVLYTQRKRLSRKFEIKINKQ